MIVDTPSRRDGMTYEEELSKRQQGGVFIFDIVTALTLGKGEHGLSGVAATLFNRFYNIHSFKRCDFRDVAAACVFLSGKNEDSPKKLKYVVNHLWQLKYPQMKHFPSEQTFMEQCNVVTFLEEVVLRTISFDINVDLPHQYILKLMRDVEKGRNVYKEMVKTAYYMATDILIITDWSVRYTCASIATACVNIAAYFHNIQMDDIVPLDLADQWYCFQDSSMTRGEVELMTKEFLDIYARNPLFHVGSLKKIDVYGRVKIVGRSPPSQSQSQAPQQPTLTSSGSSSNLKKIDMESYKGRQKGPMVDTPTSTTSTSAGAPRQSFLPDVKNQKVVERGLMEHHQQRQQQRQQNNHHHHHHQSRPSSSSSSSAQPPQQNQQHYQKNHHQTTTESVKRPQAFENSTIFSTKKFRMDYNGSFVACSSSSSTKTTTIMDNNGGLHQTTTMTQQQQHQETSLYARQFQQPPPSSTQMLPPPPPPPTVPVMAPPPAQSDYLKMCMALNDKSSTSFQKPTIYSGFTSPPSPPHDVIDTTNFSARRVIAAAFDYDSSSATTAATSFDATSWRGDRGRRTCVNEEEYLKLRYPYHRHHDNLPHFFN